MNKTCNYFIEEEQDNKTILKHTKQDISISKPTELVKYCSKNCQYYQKHFEECAENLVEILLQTK